MSSTAADAVIVVGAGAAGLAAAHRLTAAGVQTVVLEARNRLGGRVHTVTDPLWPVPIERGAEFIHGRPPETWDIIRAAGLAAYEIEGEQWRRTADGLERADEQWESMTAALERLENIGADDLSFADFLATCARDLPASVKTLASRYIEGFDAADLDLISAQSLAKADRAAAEIEGDRLFRLVDGYGRMLKWFWTSSDQRLLDVRLGTIVSAISWRPGDIELHVKSASGTPLSSWRARCAVITLPLGVLQAPPGSLGAVRFSPELPEKQAALGQLKMGPVVKVILRFDESFWERGQLDRVSFLHVPDEPFPTWWTSLPLRVPLWTGWAGGPAADRLSHRNELEILEAGLSSLARGLDLSRPQLAARLRGWHVCDWQSDSFARGAYSYVLVGGGSAVAQLAKPVAGFVKVAEGEDPGTNASAELAIAPIAQ